MRKADTSKRNLDVITAKRVVLSLTNVTVILVGDMMSVIKQHFLVLVSCDSPERRFSWRTKRKGCTTADVFGNELHRYSIADGIRDKNVLGFDPSKF
jgi:type I restriction enzyme R subunit